MLYSQHLLARFHIRLREQVIDLTSYHGLDQIRIGDPVHIIGSDILRITENSTREARRYISSKRWEMKIMETPSSLNLSTSV